MNLKDILAIVGYSGLYKFISQGRNSVIVESLSDGKKTNLPASARISSLEDIAIFTETDEIPFEQILKIIYEKEKGHSSISPKSSPQELKQWFAEILPAYDRNRVYVSDMKKIALWYNQLVTCNLIDFKAESSDSEESRNQSL